MLNVLVVDDSPVVRNFHINILKASGFKTDEACDGMEALEKSIMRKYDLILSDINMPKLDGIEFIRKYREEDKKTPIIILTTQSETIHRRKGYEAGANLYIVKPVMPENLIMHIKILTGDKNNEYQGSGRRK